MTDAGYEIGLRRIKETDFYAEYEVLVQWSGFPKPKSGEVFILNKTNNGWRVSDSIRRFLAKKIYARIFKGTGFLILKKFLCVLDLRS